MSKRNSDNFSCLMFINKNHLSVAYEVVLKRSSLLNLVFERVPTLCFQFKFLSVAGNQVLAEILLRDVAYLLHTLHFLDFGMIAYWYGKEKFVILATIHGTGSEVHVEFLCHYCRLIVYWNVFLIYTTSAVTLFTDVH